MKTRYIAMVMTSALSTLGLIPLASAQTDPGSVPAGIEVITVVGKRPTQEGIEVITVVGKRPSQEGIEVITVVGKRPAPTVASTCVNEAIAGRVTGNRDGHRAVDAQALEARRAIRNSMRQSINDCIEQAQPGATQS